MDVERAADLYAQGWTLRQIGAELDVTATTVSQQLRRAGVAMRRRYLSRQRGASDDPYGRTVPVQVPRPQEGTR